MLAAALTAPFAHALGRPRRHHVFPCRTTRSSLSGDSALRSTSVELVLGGHGPVPGRVPSVAPDPDQWASMRQRIQSRAPAQSFLSCGARTRLSSRPPRRGQLLVLLSTPRALLLALAAIVLSTMVFSAKGVLQDIHWDAPIYLQRARVFVETPYLREFAANAQVIASELRQFKADQGVSTPYWSFIRLGNTALLGGVTLMAGPGATAIHAAFWLYIALLMAAIVLIAETAMRVAQLLNLAAKPAAVVTGALLSAGLYLASDVCRHLAGNFVAEVPALFLLAVSLLALVGAVSAHSRLLGMVSGVTAFLMYVVKMDSIWVWLSFTALLPAVLPRAPKDRSWWPALVAAWVTAGACYVAYALWFWPLPDPRLIVVFQRAHDESAANPIHPLKLLVAAGGLLWIGLALALIYARRERALWFAIAWLALACLPYVPAIVDSRPSQVRIFALVMPPLLLASTIGWAAVAGGLTTGRVRRAALWVLGVFIAVALSLSHQESYSALRQLPGAWRLQYVKEWLSPPNYERLSYPLESLERLTEFLYADPLPKVLVIDQPKNAELVSLVEVLRPRAAAPMGLETTTLCGRELDLGESRVSSCLEAPGAAEVAALGDRVRVLYLQRLDGDRIADHPAAGAVIFRSGPLALRVWNASGS